MAQSDDERVLHEGALADEFGLSRTPIRQVLQRLAYERLVQVQSGVGTIVTPLGVEHRERDLDVARALLVAAGTCAEGATIPIQVKLDIAGLAGLLRSGAECSGETMFDLRSRFLEILSSLVADRILDDCVRASQWRLIRWRLRDFADNPAVEIARFSTLLRHASQACETDSAQEILTRVAGSES